MIIDFHTHAFPDALAARVIPMLAERSRLKPRSDGTVAGLRASMKRAGVDASVLLEIATKPEQTPTINKAAIALNSKDIIAFGSVHPLYAKWRDEIDRLSEAGIKGVKFHPDYQNFFVDDDSMRPIYEYILSKGLIISFHAGVDIGLPDPVHCAPEAVMKMHDILKHGTVVLAHTGGWYLWEQVERLLVGTEFYFDTSFCSEYLALDMFQRIVVDHGYRKILMGSDSPWEDQEASIKYVRALGLTPEAEAAVLGGNAARILGLDGGAAEKAK